MNWKTLPAEIKGSIRASILFVIPILFYFSTILLRESFPSLVRNSFVVLISVIAFIFFSLLILVPLNLLEILFGSNKIFLIPYDYVSISFPSPAGYFLLFLMYFLLGSLIPRMYKKFKI